MHEGLVGDLMMRVYSIGDRPRKSLTLWGLKLEPATRLERVTC